MNIRNWADDQDCETGKLTSKTISDRDIKFII